MEYWLLEELQPYEGQMDGNYRSLEEINNRLQNQIVQKELSERKLNIIQIDFERSKNLHKDGVIADKDLEIKEIEYLQMQEQVNGIAISISEMQEALTLGNQTLRSTQIDKREDEMRSLKDMVQSYHGLKRAIREWEYNYILSSSTGGVVSFQKIWSANQQINLDESAFTVFPENKSELIGSMKIPAHNAGKITVDQKVLIKLDNYPYQQFGAMTGKVTNMSVSPDDESNYLVFASLPEGTKTSYNREIPLTQELLGNAEIIMEDLSVAERLFFKLKSFTVY
jgi:multidrug resistance efflux pump